jgi:WD40 repeat protein
VRTYCPSSNNQDFALSHDQQNLLCRDGNELVFYDLQTDRETRRAAIPSPNIQISGNLNERYFLVSGEDHFIEVWDIEQDALIRRYETDDTVTHMSFADDGRYIVYGAHNVVNVLRFHDNENLQDWIRENRYIRTFSCEEHLLYGLEPCEGDTSSSASNPVMEQTITPSIEPTIASPGVRSNNLIPASGTVESENRIGDQTRWTFEANAGEVVTIIMRSIEFDTYLELYDEDNQFITENDDFDGLNSQIGPIELSRSGTYTIIARSFANQGGGAYQIEFIRESSAATTTDIVSETPVDLGCFAAPPSRIASGMSIRVGENGGRPLRLRSDANYQSELLAELPPGTPLSVIGGPACGLDNNQTFQWWQVQTSNGFVGWVAEGDSTQNPVIYFIEPSQ